MPQPMKGPRFGGNAAHSRIILRNLTSQLFEHGRVVTTLAKAKQVRPIAEKLITRAKVDTVANRRIVNRTITDKGVSHVLFTEIAPMMAERNGGYTRIIKTLMRAGWKITPEDVAALSPYVTSHVKRFGDYLIDVDALPEPYEIELALAA